MELFDLHADIGYDVMQKRRLGEHHILDRYHVDKLRKGGISFLCMASCFEGEEEWGDMQEMILALKEEITLCDEIDFVQNKDDLLNDNGHIKAILSVEGMCGIKEDVKAKVEWLYQQGIRIASLCWNDENELATGVRGNPERGLSEKGKEVIECMIQHSMMIDVSHANEKTFWDIMGYKEAIVMATHSNARDLCEHPRNLYKNQLEAIKQHHGIVGVVSAPFFVDVDSKKQDIAHMIKHMQYLCEVMGEDSVALGLDYMDFYKGYEGVYVKELMDASYSQNLPEAMSLEMDAVQVAMLSLGNALRFITKHL